MKNREALIEKIKNWKAYVDEDWEFEITVLDARPCRLDFKAGDKFFCKYECPTGFCSKTMALLYTLCEVKRCGGDFRLRGSEKGDEIDFPCADGAVTFRLKAKHIET